MPEVVQAIRALPVHTKWKIVEQRQLDFDVHHPQGLVKRGDTFYLTSVEKTDGHAKGRGWISKFSFSAGKPSQTVPLTDVSRRFHPGGLDDDDKFLYTPVAEYRPHSKATVMKIDPETLKAEAVLQVDDHLGAAFRDDDTDQIVGANWDGEEFYFFGDTVHKRRNPSGELKLQDCKYAGDGYALCTGARNKHGGIELHNLRTGKVEHRVDVDVLSKQGRPMTYNPVTFEVLNGKLRLYCAPDDVRGTLYVLEPAQ